MSDANTGPLYPTHVVNSTILGIINKKRATLEEGTKDATVPDSERDLLELMLESEQTTRGKLTNAELLVRTILSVMFYIYVFMLCSCV